MRAARKSYAGGALAVSRESGSHAEAVAQPCAAPAGVAAPVVVIGVPASMLRDAAALGKPATAAWAKEAIAAELGRRDARGIR